MESCACLWSETLNTYQCQLPLTNWIFYWDFIIFGYISACAHVHTLLLCLIYDSCSSSNSFPVTHRPCKFNYEIHFVCFFSRTRKFRIDTSRMNSIDKTLSTRLKWIVPRYLSKYICRYNSYSCIADRHHSHSHSVQHRFQLGPIFHSSFRIQRALGVSTTVNRPFAMHMYALPSRAIKVRRGQIRYYTYPL